MNGLGAEGPAIADLASWQVVTAAGIVREGRWTEAMGSCSRRLGQGTFGAHGRESGQGLFARQGADGLGFQGA